MTLAADEFIRRFRLHTLPDGFHRIRHYGFLANRQRAAKLALCRRPSATLPPAIAPAAPHQAAKIITRLRRWRLPDQRHRCNPHSRTRHPAGSLNPASMRSRLPLRPTPVPRDLTEASRFRRV
jgi:hypothetical protein